MQMQNRKAVRPCTLGPAHKLTIPHAPWRKDDGDFPTRMAVDCLITLALFRTVPWLEILITRQVMAELGPRVRRSCVCGTAVRLTREQAEREGWPWPAVEDVVARMAQVEWRRGGAR